jgi:hypothetical protein
MSTRQSTASRRVFSASNALKVVGDALADIKREDGLTYTDLGRVLGKGEDQASKYCDAAADMGLVSFLLAWREFNGRLMGPVKCFVEETRPIATDDRRGHTTILEAALALSVALQDGAITAEEVRANRATLENARDAIEAQLAKLRPAA